MELGSELAEEEESPAQGETPSDDGNLEALRLLLAYHQISADAVRMRHILGHGETATGEDLVRLAKRQGGRAKLIDASWEELETLPLPGLVEGRDGRFQLLGRAGREAVLLHDTVAEQTREVSRAEFEAAFTTKVLLLTTRHSTAGPQRRFDVSWFIPALVRYRRHLGQVLVASFTLQIIGLLSPLFFQVVIDKVLVHKSLTTLEVMAVGLLGVFVFETLMTARKRGVFAPAPKSGGDKGVHVDCLVRSRSNLNPRIFT